MPFNPTTLRISSKSTRSTLASHEFADLSGSVQLSSEHHEATFARLRAKSSVRSKNLLLATTMHHASDWLLTAPIPGLGLSMRSENFRMAMKFRLGMKLFEKSFPCPAVSHEGKTCDEEMDVFGDHALCCHYGTALVYRHNNVRDILGHAARAAGLAAVVLEQNHLVSDSKKDYQPSLAEEIY